ncbi:hypothetical protein AVEN_275652-1 [Araneus ventricosus]|uniref:Uncharacterized protein n=1 Tax=Araneus ventricosus TaxID=182803 RepID=A0A4Y2WM55_ARAVE|nr:hypothetical protein AVEN_275652-1 [Araneus ventricosus]
MPPKRLLQQYPFHMTTTAGDKTLQASQKSSNPRVQQTMSLLPGSRKTTSPTIHVHLLSLWIRSAGSDNRLICIFPPKSLVPAPSIDCFLSYFFLP